MPAAARKAAVFFYESRSNANVMKFSSEMVRRAPYLPLDGGRCHFFRYCGQYHLIHHAFAWSPFPVKGKVSL